MQKRMEFELNAPITFPASISAIQGPHRLTYKQRGAEKNLTFCHPFYNKNRNIFMQ